MIIEKTAISGCLLLRMDLRRDTRGSFVKTFQRDMFASHGLAIEFAEEFYTDSIKNVLRGLHCQLPPHDHVKIVGCVHGEVFDVLLDLRQGSPTYGKHAIFRLADKEAIWLYVPRGIAHGFYTISDLAIMAYKTTSSHAPSHDSGVLWNSAGIPWPCNTPILSDRDQKLAPLNKFTTPFAYDAEAYEGRQ